MYKKSKKTHLLLKQYKQAIKNLMPSITYSVINMKKLNVKNYKL